MRTRHDNERGLNDGLSNMISGNPNMRGKSKDRNIFDKKLEWLLIPCNLSWLFRGGKDLKIPLIPQNFFLHGSGGRGNSMDKRFIFLLSSDMFEFFVKGILSQAQKEFR